MATFWLGLLFGLLTVFIVASLFGPHAWKIEDEPFNHHIDLYAK